MGSSTKSIPLFYGDIFQSLNFLFIFDFIEVKEVVDKGEGLQLVIDGEWWVRNVELENAEISSVIQADL